MFTILVGIIALLVAGCAAFFSVQGLATLYAAKFIAVCIMAGGLELGKLTAASFLHRYWKTTSWLLKIYLTIAVIVLMAITSLGIFGFLTGAYEQSHIRADIVGTKQEVLDAKKQFLTEEVGQLNDRIKTLNEARKSQEARLTGISRRSAIPIYEDIKRSSEEISKTRVQIDTLTSQLFEVNRETIAQKVDASKEIDIGTLKYVAKSFGVSVDTVVKWFTLTIVFVFDPLAVALVLAYNTLVEAKRVKTPLTEQTESEQKFSSSIRTALKNIINYRA